MSSRSPTRRDAGHGRGVRRRFLRADLATAVVDDFRRIIRVLRLAARRAEAELGLSGAQVFVLQKLSEGPAESLNELAERTLTHQSSVSVVVRRLVERGLVARHRSPVDQRRLELRLTPAGERLARRAAPAPQTQLVETIGCFARTDLRMLARLLHQVAEGMGAARLSPDMMFADGGAGSRPRPRRATHRAGGAARRSQRAARTSVDA